MQSHPEHDDKSRATTNGNRVRVLTVVVVVAVLVAIVVLHLTGAIGANSH